MEFANYWFSSGEASQGGADRGYPIGNSLRWRNNNQSFVYDGTQPEEVGTDWTVSFWYKAANIGYDDVMVWSTSQNGNYSYIVHKNDGRFSLRRGTSAIYSTGYYRDNSAWYHIVLTNDNFWINNQEDFSGGDLARFVASNTNGHQIAYWSSGYESSLYMTELHFVQGQKLTPSTFGRVNDTGVWVPVSPYKDGNTTWYGANGYHLDFKDPSDIGKDVSGNNNHFIASADFELDDPTSPDYDWVLDSPTRNQAMLNSLETSWWAGGGSTTGSLKDGNRASHTSRDNHNRFTQYPQPGQKLYYEVYAPTYYEGLVPQDFPVGTGYVGNTSSRGVGFYKTGDLYYGSSVVGTNEPFTASDTVMMAYDVDTGKVWQGTNGTWHNSGNPATGANATYTIPAGEIWQFASNQNGGSNPINLGHRAFKYTLPQGFTGIETDILPEAKIPNGREHFRVIADTGANILNSAKAAFPEGVWWIKDRVNTLNMQIVRSDKDTSSVRLAPSSTNAAYTTPTGNSVAWCWGAPDAFTDNTGDLNTSGYRDLKSGFSYFNYTGNGNNTQSMGHGLDQKPDWVMLFRTSNNGTNASVWTPYRPNTSARLVLETQAASANYSDVFPQDPDENYFYIGNNNICNKAGDEYLGLAWFAVPGYSAMGTYTGNGNSNGSFVYTGFRPAFVMIKAASRTGYWNIYDTQRSVYNPTGEVLRPDVGSGTKTSADYAIDMVSNGFKLRSTFSDINNNNSTYVYLAFAENPYGGESTVPVAAR